MKPTITKSYDELHHDVIFINNMLKRLYEMEVGSDYYTQWKEGEIEYWTNCLIATNIQIDAKLEQLPFEIINQAISNTQMTLNIAPNF